MKQVFDALQLRFNGDDVLRGIGRILLLGIEKTKGTSNYPFVNVSFGETESLDTFGADIRKYPLTWTMYTRDPKPTTAADFVEQMKRVFDNANVRSPWFTCVDCECKGAGGP